MGGGGQGGAKCGKRCGERGDARPDTQVMVGTAWPGVGLQKPGAGPAQFVNSDDARGVGNWRCGGFDEVAQSKCELGWAAKK